MKKKYKYLLYWIAIEFMVLYCLGENGFKLKTPIQNMIGIVIVLLPVQILFFLMGRDENYSKGKKICFKLIFWYINIVVVAAIATLFF